MAREGTTHVLGTSEWMRVGGDVCMHETSENRKGHSRLVTRNYGEHLNGERWMGLNWRSTSQFTRHVEKDAQPSREETAQVLLERKNTGSRREASGWWQSDQLRCWPGRVGLAWLSPGGRAGTCPYHIKGRSEDAFRYSRVQKLNYSWFYLKDLLGHGL